MGLKCNRIVYPLYHGAKEKINAFNEMNESTTHEACGLYELSV